MEDAGMKTGRMEAAGGKDSAKERSSMTEAGNLRKYAEFPTG